MDEWTRPELPVRDLSFRHSLVPNANSKIVRNVVR
jgi:hypothetical protein